MKCKMAMWFSSDLTFKLILFLVFLLSLLAPAFFNNKNFIYSNTPSSNKVKNVVKSTGSTSMSHIISILKSDFESFYPGYFYEKSETGSGTAAFLVKDKEADIGDMSRYMNDEEKSDVLETKCIALDGIAVIVNNKNEINNLTTENLQDIFSKKINNWSEISDKFSGKIVTVGREEGSGTRDGFESGMNIKNSEYDIILPESGDISAKVANEPGAIGYISLASISNNIHAVSIDNIACNAENIRNGTYLLIRPFLQVFDKNNNNEAMKIWFEFLNSERAKNIIEGEKLIHV